MKNRCKKITYEAIGFVEALIAILLVGVSSLVLLQIAINTLNSAIQNEVIDHMTQYAMEGAELIREAYNKHKMEGPLGDEDLEESEMYFPPVDGDKNCFVINKVGGKVYFNRDEDTGEFIRYKKSERSEYRNKALIDFEDQKGDSNKPMVNIGDQFFRIVCLEDSLEDDKPFLVTRVVVGQRYFDEGLFKNEEEPSEEDDDSPRGKLHGNFVRDYEYLTIIKK